MRINPFKIAKTSTLAAVELVRMILQYKEILWATTLVELKKRYAGSILGFLWVFIYPALLLCLYLFVYLVVFRVRFPGFSEYHYVLYIFSGLIPYLGFMEALSLGTVSVKQNIHLVKNVMLPIELVPIRTVLIGIASQLVSLVILFFMVALDGKLSFHILWLPIVLFLQILFMMGLVLVLSFLAIPLPDISYFVNLFLLLILFISPIGFKPDMVPERLDFIIYLNPISYMAEMYRDCLLFGKFPNLYSASLYIFFSVATFAVGAAIFKKSKGFLMDHE
ncbi:MAG: ABC transporter permease [Candidatus Nitrohelix vancouverensis]|uniref:Transport permease protein n=1 Tax=Candidatus Nitrohelix vancouverensis TaxID=2705534 RepID=A0A7T0C2H1_9BACT|nr:MAG: ABC transporter permease [Candidatus Nitrohelix vancouverensis]